MRGQTGIQTGRGQTGIQTGGGKQVYRQNRQAGHTAAMQNTSIEAKKKKMQLKGKP
jgi:hypothetical protein